MYSADFAYYRASSLDEAQRLLRQHRGATLLAGGHSLIPLLKLRLAAPAAIIDIGRVGELRGITREEGTIRIGALTTHAELAASPVLREACAVLARAAALIGDPAVRNRGTIGGNVAHADPASDLPPVLLALGARVTLAGPKGTRTLEAADFFQGVMATALGEDEVLTAVQVPALGAGQRGAYEKFSHPASRYAVIGAAAVLTIRGGTCEAARVAVGGLVPAPVRGASVEAALAGKKLSPEILEEAAARITEDLGDDLLGDIFASADYRRAVVPVYVKRALSAAAGSG